MRHPTCLLAALAIGWCSGARANETFIQETTLERVVREADAAVEVRADQPPSRKITEPITPKGQAPNASKWPPIVRSLERMIVVAVLFDASGKLKPGVHLEIEDAHWREDAELHRKYYLEHIGKSPIYDRYRPSDAGQKSTAQTRIYFLDHSSGRWALAVEGATEVATDEMKAKIGALRKSR